MKEAVTEEKIATKEKGTIDDEAGIAVSGDGTWKKRGFSSRFGVTILIGILTGKVVDILVKSSYCKACEFWEKRTNTAEYEEWKQEHECFANHTGSAGKMEVEGMQEMFQRSVELRAVKYLHYIEDGDCKTFNCILKTNPYDIPVIKKECVGHVQKRMGTRLRALKKNTKGLGGKGKLTGKCIDELQTYYGLAIRRNADSMEKMKAAIWATFLHKISTDEKPQHENCPSGEDSWCSWQRAYATNTLTGYKHKTALPQNIQDAIRPIYEDLSRDDLLSRCVGGYTQNNNESLNDLIWKIASKETYCTAVTVEIAAYIAAAIFNKGHMSLLTMLQTLNVSIGNAAYNMCQEIDAQRICTAELRTLEATKESRIRRRQNRLRLLDGHTVDEGQLYGAGIAD
nr:uncharacterized protein LOC111426132 [Onthophagus taurus]